MDDEALDKYLTENEKNFSSGYDNPEGSQNLEENPQQDDDLKSLSSKSEIPQEEIIQMSNLSNLFASETTCSQEVSKSLKVTQC